MYEAFYGFREKPFSLVPDPDFLYLGKHHRAALNILEYGLRGEASFALISGEVGSGKTILIRRFLRMVDTHTTVGLITNTHASLGNLLDWILLAFNLDYHGKAQVELFEILTNFLRDQQMRGRRTVLIIDEAQNMNSEMLEELRMLSNINVDKELMFQIVLAGQPEILEKINKPELRQLAQRISANFHLSPFTLDETRNYICHRLAIAGGRQDIFDNLACAAVYHFTEGLPRPINVVCDAALVYGFGEDRKAIGLETVLDVVENVQRSGLKTLRTLEGGFNREELSEKITALAQTFTSPEPPQDNHENLLSLRVGPAKPAAEGSGRKAGGKQGGSAPVDTPEAEGPTLRGVRDVPAGIPPLINDGAQDSRLGGDGDRAATKRKKWWRLLQAAAAAVLVVTATVSLLRAFDVWSQPPASQNADAQKAENAADAGAPPAETAATEDTNGNEDGLLHGLLSAFGWGGNGAATTDGTPIGVTGPSVTIALEDPDEVERRVASLLQLAQEQAAESVRTARDGDDAYRTYQQILALKPGFEPALEGIRELKGQDPELAHSAGQNDRAAAVDQPEPSPAEPTAPLAAAQEDEPAADEAPSAAEPLQTAALPASPVTPTYTHWVRLGTFRHPESAPIMWRRLERDQADLLGNLNHEIANIEAGDHGTLYLLRVGPLAGVEASKSLCRTLAARGVDCLVSSVRSEVAALPQATPVKTGATNLAKIVSAPNSAAGQSADLYKSALAHSHDGEAYSKNGDYDRAIKEFSEAIRLNPKLAAAHYSRGEIYFRKGDYAQAIRDFTKTIDLAPDYTFAYYSRGVANEKTGDIKEAILDFSHTVRLKPGFAPAYNDRARALFNMGHLKEALRDSELAISIAPDKPRYLATHSQILAALGQNEGAFATLEKAMAVANTDWIRQSQQAMSREGYYRGPIDGRYGPATKSAMKACLVSGCNLANWN
jgi:general secretion pathway protein A